MDIEQIEKMWATDCKLDATDLIAESSKIPEMHSKYYKLYIRAAMKATELRAKLKQLEKAKTEYYNGTMAEEDLKELGWKPNPLKILKSDIAKYIDSDQDVINQSLMIDYYSSMAKFLEDIIRQINNRNFLIKNMVELMKFQNGGY